VLERASVSRDTFAQVVSPVEVTGPMVSRLMQWSHRLAGAADLYRIDVVLPRRLVTGRRPSRFRLPGSLAWTSSFP